MRRLEANELSGLLRAAANNLVHAADMVNKGEAEAMNLAALGYASTEANNAGVEAYKRAGLLAFKAMQMIMYTQLGRSEVPDLKDSAETCVDMFANISTNGFLYPIFAKTGCPSLFTSFGIAAYNNDPNNDTTADVDSNLNVSNADRLMVIAYAHEDYATRKKLAAVAAAPSPFDALYKHLDGGSGGVLHIQRCDAVGVAATATPLGVENGLVLGTWIDDVDGDYKFNGATTTVNIEGSSGAVGAPANGYEGWLANEHFIQLNMDFELGAGNDYVVLINASSDATDIVEGSNLLIRLIADNFGSLTGKDTGYDPST